MARSPRAPSFGSWLSFWAAARSSPIGIVEYDPQHAVTFLGVERDGDLP